MSIFHKKGPRHDGDDKHAAEKLSAADAACLEEASIVVVEVGEQERCKLCSNVAGYCSCNPGVSNG